MTSLEFIKTPFRPNIPSHDLTNSIRLKFKTSRSAERVEGKNSSLVFIKFSIHWHVFHNPLMEKVRKWRVSCEKIRFPRESFRVFALMPSKKNYTPFIIAARLVPFSRNLLSPALCKMTFGVVEEIKGQRGRRDSKPLMLMPSYCCACFRFADCIIASSTELKRISSPNWLEGTINKSLP